MPISSAKWQVPVTRLATQLRIHDGMAALFMLIMGPNAAAIIAEQSSICFAAQTRVTGTGQPPETLAGSYLLNLWGIFPAAAGIGVFLRALVDHSVAIGGIARGDIIQTFDAFIDGREIVIDGVVQ